jgi:hypothetical protein
MRRLLMGLMLVLGAAGPSCGGGAREPTVQRVFVFGPIPTTTGFLTEQQSGSGPVYIPSVDTAIRVGDTGGNEQTKGFVSFDIASLPEGAQVTFAVMRMTQEFVSGIPYGVLGDGVGVDHVDLGGELDADDWAGNGLGFGIGLLSRETELIPYDVEVSQEVALALTLNRNTVDFRLSFELPSDQDANPDQAEFTKPGEIAQPVLEVTATVPNR